MTESLKGEFGNKEQTLERTVPTSQVSSVDKVMLKALSLSRVLPDKSSHLISCKMIREVLSADTRIDFLR